MILEQADLQVMKLCKMPMEELLRETAVKYDIPPLWSVLSYAMLLGGSAEGIMREYRRLQKLAENTAPFYYRETVPKANGGLRLLFVPSYRLREQQQRILRLILEALPVDEHAYAYRKGVSFRDCAAPHMGKDWLIHLDLKNFFGSVKENMVFDALLRDTGYPPALCRFFARLCCLHGSLPQGTATSPALSNIVLRPCDEALAKLAETYAVDYTRYSDDLFFSGNGTVDVGQVIREVTALLAGFGFCVNREKTRVRRRQHRQSVLGLTVNEGVQVSREYRRSLAREIYYLERFGKDADGVKKEKSYLRYVQKLLGKVNYVLQIDPENQKFINYRRLLQNRLNRYDYEQRRTPGMVTHLAEEIEKLNARYGLQISLEAIREAYGTDAVMQLAGRETDTLANIRCLIDMGFGSDVTHICNGYGYILYEDDGYFRWKVRDLISTFGVDYVEILRENMSLWETLL